MTVGGIAKSLPQYDGHAARQGGRWDAELAHCPCPVPGSGWAWQLLGATADTNGLFQVGIPPGMETFIGCHPPAFPNLVLATFVSTVGVAAGQTRPETGLEEISPRTTMIANILAETQPADRQQRKTELLHALGEQDPDISLLAGAATALFNAMLQSQITAVDFTPSSIRVRTVRAVASGMGGKR